MIKFVFFDVGGVVIRDFNGNNKWAEVKTELGIKSADSDEFDRLYNLLEVKICKGRDLQTIVPVLKEKFKITLPENYSMLTDGFVKRFEYNQSVWPVIGEIKKNCRVGLLTNMYPGMLDAIRQQGLLPDISWDAIVDSSLTGLKKPEKEIFEYAENLIKLKDKDILFVDNGLENIEIAEAIGWKTFLYNSADPETSSGELSRFYRKL